MGKFLMGIFNSPYEAYNRMHLVNIGINDIYNNHKDINPRLVLDYVREFLLQYPYTNTDSCLSTWIIKWFEFEGKKEMPKIAEFYYMMLLSMIQK